MEYITEYVKSIAVFMLVNAFVCTLLPNGSFKSYVSLIMGIILVIIILSPVRDFAAFLR